MWASARLFLLAVVVSGCASVAPIDAAVRRPAPPDTLRFGVDTFAFANESRSKNDQRMPESVQNRRSIPEGLTSALDSTVGAR